MRLAGYNKDYLSLIICEHRHGVGQNTQPAFKNDRERLGKWKHSTLVRLAHSYLHGNGREYAGCCALNPGGK